MTTLKKIDNSSQIGIENSLSIFDLPPTNVAINKSQVREILPLTALNDSGPYVFRMFADSHFIDLSKTWFYLATRIERFDPTNAEWVVTDETNNEYDKKIAVINNFGHSFIQQLKININNVEVFSSGPLYAYRAYILHELGYSHETRKGLHEANCYYTDSKIDQDNVESDGYKARQARFAKGAICETMVKLNFDLARQENLMLSNSDVIFTIHRNNDDFLLHSPFYKKGDTTISASSHREYRIKIIDMRLYVRCVDVTQSLNNAISRQLEVSSAKYPIRRVEMRSLYLSKGRSDAVWNVFTSVIPRRLIIGLVSNDAFAGKKHLSPFVFEHAKIRSISVEAHGNVYPASPYVFDFEHNRFIRAFIDMYSGLMLDDGDRTISIGLAKFKATHCFFVVPLTSTLDDSPGFELIKNGTTTIKVQFADEVKEIGYEMICLGEFDSIVSISSDRIISNDGQV